jgi:hypothetical protein
LIALIAWVGSLTIPVEGSAARAPDGNLERRGEGHAVIGLAAEELAYLYSALERWHLFGNAMRSGDYAVNDLFAKAEVSVSQTTLRSLFDLDAANFVEGPLTSFDEFDGEIPRPLSIAVGGGTAIRDATGLCSGHCQV